MKAKMIINKINEETGGIGGKIVDAEMFEKTQHQDKTLFHELGIDVIN